jgi:hypothetical protein
VIRCPRNGTFTMQNVVIVPVSAVRPLRRSARRPPGRHRGRAHRPSGTRAALAEQASLGEAAQEPALLVRGGVQVLELDRGGQHGHRGGRFGGWLGSRRGSPRSRRVRRRRLRVGRVAVAGSKHSMSRMLPIGSATHAPAPAAGPDLPRRASTACSIGVSAPSNRIRAQANGCASGWPSQRRRHPRPGDHLARRSRPRRVRSAVVVTGSYSTGGDVHPPVRAADAEMRRSRRAVMNRQHRPERSGVVEVTISGALERGGPEAAS